MTATKAALFETFVETFTDITGKEGVLILDSKGKILFQKFEPEDSAKKIGDWIKNIIISVSKTTDKFQTSQAKQMLLDHTHRRE